MSLVLVLSATLLAQNLPPELKRRDQGGLDPVLPAALMPAVSAAAEAERDPKRGVGNAVEILKAERRKHEGDRQAQMLIDLRVAAAVLRSRFATNEKVARGVAVQQALSTYSKLQLSEPGLGGWLSATLDANPAVKQALAAKDGKRVAINILLRGSGLDRPWIEDRVASPLAKIGLAAARVPAEQAEFVLKLASDQLVEPGKKPAVRVVLEVEQLEGKRTIWRRSYFRTSEAADPNVAVRENVAWLIEIGGRDLLFQWLTHRGLDSVFMQAPKSDGHDHGGHEDRVRLEHRGPTQPEKAP